MRVLSPHLGYEVQIHEGSEVREADSRTGETYTRTTKQPLVATFEQGGIFPHELELALRVFEGNWRGLPEGVAPQGRISVYDTEVIGHARGWAKEYQDGVEDRLRALAADRPSLMIVAEDIAPAKPWPKYDEANEDEVLEFATLLGIDPQAVFDYEVQNAGRAFVLEALQSIIDSKATEVATVNA